jgi:hypothetical protein
VVLALVGRRQDAMGGRSGMLVCPKAGRVDPRRCRAAQQRSGRAYSWVNAYASSAAHARSTARHELAGVAHDPGGDMPQPVAHCLGLGTGDQFQPDAAAAPEVAQAGGPGGADAIFDPGALTVPQLQPGKVRVGW